MKKAIRANKLDGAAVSPDTKKMAYVSPKLQSLGDIRGVTMGTGSKQPDLFGGGLQA